LNKRRLDEELEAPFSLLVRANSVQFVENGNRNALIK